MSWKKQFKYILTAIVAIVTIVGTIISTWCEIQATKQKNKELDFIVTNYDKQLQRLYDTTSDLQQRIRFLEQQSIPKFKSLWTPSYNKLSKTSKEAKLPRPLSIDKLKKKFYIQQAR